ncbi:MAG: hypothetical protein WC796_01725 [Candidatus Pacearchaeota archaeon]|jgi:hypothetical protein
MEKLNKRGMVLAIGVFVLMTMILIGAALFYFITEKSKIDKRFEGSSVLEEVYAKENLINFYVQDILDKAVQSKPKTSQELIIALKSSIGSYNINNPNPLTIEESQNPSKYFFMPELLQVENQIDFPDRVKIQNNKAFFTVDISLKKEIFYKGKKNFDVTYVYTKTFESEIS